MGKRKILLVFIILFIMSAPSFKVSRAESISSPSKINKVITDFSDLDLKPGEDGKFEFKFNNPYDYSMKNISLEIELYSFRSFENGEEITEVDKPVYFVSDDGVTKIISRSELKSDQGEIISLEVKTDEDTRKGVYSLRFKLSFDMDDHRDVMMRSVGYFDDEELEDASRSSGIKDEQYFVGGYNLSKLGVDGILRETTISVKDPMPRWPQYLLVAATAVLSILAVYHYLKEEES